MYPSGEDLLYSERIARLKGELDMKLIGQWEKALDGLIENLKEESNNPQPEYTFGGSDL